MNVNITEAAARRISHQLSRRGRGLGLRLGVRESGCSGFAYALDYADDIADDDRVFEAHGVKVVVSAGSLPLVDGITLDFRRDGLNEMFVFNNPNAEDLCGCGESFSVRRED